MDLEQVLDRILKRRRARAPLLRGLAALLLALSVPAFAPRAVRAGGVVGDGTPGSCTEASFKAAMSGGGLVTFNCGSAMKSIPLTSVKNITASTRIDGNERITLYSDLSYYGTLFYVVAYATLELDNLGVRGNLANGEQRLIDNPGGHLIVYNSSLYWGYGGAIENAGTLELIDSEVWENTSGLGAGLFNAYGQAIVLHSTFAGNNANAGGAIYNNGSATLILVDSTLSGNRATVDGGGIFNHGTASLYNVTIADNYSDDDLDGSGTGGGVFNNAGTLYLTNSILSENYESLYMNPPSAWVPIYGDCAGTLFSLDYNIFLNYNHSRCTVTGFTANNLETDPLLGPLALNGGRKRTHALLAGSPAIDYGDPGYLCWYRDLQNEVQEIMRDERGVPRPPFAGMPCDVGAYERMLVKGRADQNYDARDEIGVFRNGMWFLSHSPDYVGNDLSRAFGSPTPGMDSPEIGEFGCLGGGYPDGQMDLAILRKPFSTWMVTLSPDWGSAPDLVKTFGTTGHKKIATRWLDTNGDGCSDIGVFRNGCFDVLESPGYASVGTHVCFGPGTDEPLAAGLDGDGKSDFILWRAASAHYTYELSSEGWSTPHGADLGAGDYPMLGDLNGDGLVDLASHKQATSTFRFTYSPDFVGVDLIKVHGVSGDVPVLADVNGDGRSDIGIFRSAIARWWFLGSPGWTTTALSTSFGTAGDIPIHGKPPGMP